VGGAYDSWNRSNDLGRKRLSHEEADTGQHYEVLVRLAKSNSWVSGNLDATLREVTEAAAHTMGIERVNVWLFDEQRTKIRCIEHYECSKREHSPSGVELSAADYPIYFQALREERTIAAHDACGDLRTREFAEGYLDVHGITSMLDAPLHSGGKVVGIICHEHVGAPRFWTLDEQRFAGSLADLASRALETAERVQAEGALRQSQELTREIIAHALDAIVIVDGSGIITDWNPRAETVFGWSREEAIGMTLYDSVIPPRHQEAHRLGMQRYIEVGEGPILNKRIESTAKDNHGREFPIELTVSPVQIGDSLAFSAFIRDISDRVSAELEVHKLNAQLEERVQERTHQLTTAIQEKESLLAELQESSVELLERLCEVEYKSETIRSDLERAQAIQRALLPADPPRVEGVHIDALYRPGMSVGGDLYDVTLLDDGRLALYVADASGHGVAAAMLSVLFKQRLRMCDEKGYSLSPSEVLRRVNAQLSDDVLTQGLFLTAIYLLIDVKTGDTCMASAGHTPMLLLRKSGEHVLLKRTGPALGIVEVAEFTEHRMNLQKGDRLILYTDGLIDGLESADDDEIVGLLEPALIGESRDGPARLRALYREVVRRARRIESVGGQDDVTLLMLEAESGPCSFDNDPPEEAESDTSASTIATTASPILWIAETEAETHLAVRGQGTWMQCENFRRLAQASLDAGRRLVIDLADCTHLDSAFLGTLHDVIASNPGLGTTVCRPSATICGLFAELGLEQVLETVRDDPREPPCEPVPVTRDPPERASQDRLLRAHEILSELSEENRERFAIVVSALRSELRPSG
jgi:PAS domain S-box-containing protein